MDIEILYEDDNIIPINKPAVLIVHNDFKKESFSILNNNNK